MIVRISPELSARAWLAAFAVAMCLVGLLDDIVDLRPRNKLLLELAALSGRSMRDYLSGALRGTGGARLQGSAPFVDCLDPKPPVAADAERGQLIFLQHPVDRGWMHLQVA